MHAQDESGGFWPGYVAAVASLVLSLLLIAAVLALTIYQVGLLAGKKVQAAAAAVVVPEAKAPDDGGAGASLLGAMVLEFPEQGWRLDAAAQAQLRELIAQQVLRGAQYWRLSLRTDTEDPLRLRGGYLRLLSVRNILLEAGVSGRQVDVRLIHTPEEEGAGRELRILAEMPVQHDGRVP